MGREMSEEFDAKEANDQRKFKKKESKTI